MASLLLTAIAAAGPAPQLPAALQGRWAETVEGCDAGAIHGGLTIGSASIADGEARADVLRLRRLGDGAFALLLQWDDEDETTRMTYRLSRDGHHLVTRAVGTANSVSMRRCEARP